MTNRTEHARNVFAWLNQVKRDRDLTGFVIAFEIAQHINHSTGEGYPSVRTIAKNLGLSRSTVIDAVDRLETRGHLAIERGTQGRGHSHRYRMIVKGRPADLLETEKGRRADLFESVEKVAQPTAKRSASRTEKVAQPEIKGRPADQNHLREQSKGTIESLNKGALCAPMCAHSLSPGDEKIRQQEAAKPPWRPNVDKLRREDMIAIRKIWDACNRNEITEDEAERRDDKIRDRARARARRKPDDDWPDDYRDKFWAAYPNPVGEKRALIALASVRRKRKATWATLIDGVNRYEADHRPGGPLADHKWLNPETWLKGERWNDRPAP